MKKLLILPMLLLVGCVNFTTPDNASYKRYSCGGTAGNFFQWIGLVAKAKYDQITASSDQEITKDDVDYLGKKCGEDDRLDAILTIVGE